MIEPDVVVVASGPGPAVAVPDGGTVVAADGGLERAAALARAEAAGTRIVRHPVAKDATDLELALDEALELGARRVLVIASAGGRLDHLAGSLLLLGSERFAGLELDALVGDALVHVVRSARTLHGTPGELLTLLPLGGDAEGVTTSGLEYPLDGETLGSGSTRGVSNVFTSAEARVTVAEGILLAIRPQETTP